MKKLFLLCALFLAVPAVAQEYYGLQEYGLRKNTTRVEFYGGMVLPQDDWSHKGQDVDLGGTGWTVGLGFVRNISAVFAPTGLVTGRINFFPSESTRLYIPVGIGVGHMFARQKNEDGSHLTTSSTDLATMLGLGLEFDIDETLIFGVEGRYYFLNADDEFKDAFGKGHYQYMTVMLKFGTRF